MPICRGFTLFELLFTIVVLSFVLAMAIPPLSQSIHSHAVKAESRQLKRTISLARQHAVFGGHRTVLCSLDSNSRCKRGWNDDLALFADINRNNRLDGGERMIRYWQRDGNRTRMRWQGFGPGYLRFRHSGYAAENGAYTICPADGDIKKARQLVINRVGRAYLARDRDGDGIVDYGDNKKPSC